MNKGEPHFELLVKNQQIGEEYLAALKKDADSYLPGKNIFKIQSQKIAFNYPSCMIGVFCFKIRD